MSNIKETSSQRRARELKEYSDAHNKLAWDTLYALPAEEQAYWLEKVAQIHSPALTIKQTKHLWKKNAQKDGWQTITHELGDSVLLNRYTEEHLWLAWGWKTFTFSVGDKVAFMSVFFDVWHTHNVGFAGIGFSVIKEIKLNREIVLENGMVFNKRLEQVCAPDGAHNALTPIEWLDMDNDPTFKEGPRIIQAIPDPDTGGTWHVWSLPIQQAYEAWQNKHDDADYYEGTCAENRLIGTHVGSDPDQNVDSTALSVIRTQALAKLTPAERMALGL